MDVLGLWNIIFKIGINILITDILIKAAEGITRKDIGFIMTMIVFYMSSVIHEKVFLKDWKQIINTYDTSLSIEFGRDILEVMEVIINRRNFKYIKNKKNYRKFIIIANILSRYGWIEWGTSIKGCWFDEFAEPITNRSIEVLNMNPIIINDKSIHELIEYLKSEEL